MAVPQASTPSHCGVFRVFFTLFLTFRTFSLEIPTFSPERGNGNACPLFFLLPQALRQLLPSFWQSYVGLTEHSCSNQRKHSKTRIFAVFWKNSVFFAQKRSIGCRYIVKKCDCSVPMIPYEKRRNFKIFRDHDPSERHIWSKGVYLRHAISPHPDQLETCGRPVSFVRSCTSCPPNLTYNGRLHEKGVTANHSTQFHLPVARVEYGFSSVGTCLA